MSEKPEDLIIGKSYTAEEIGKTFNVDPEKVRQGGIILPRWEEHPLPPCPNLNKPSEHPVFDELTEREQPYYQPLPDGTWREEQRWVIFRASVIASPVKSYTEDGLVDDEDESAIDAAIMNPPDWNLLYVRRGMTDPILGCGICNSLFELNFRGEDNDPFLVEMFPADCEWIPE
jgi:hypothetical protein